MVLCEERECSVCYQAFSRTDRIPRVLHCRHTFCSPCLEAMSEPKSDFVTVRCPLCRRVSCVGQGRSLQEALWVNTRLWDQIPECPEEEEQELEEDDDGRVVANGHVSLQGECASSKHSRTKLKFPAFLRKFSLTKQPQERIVPGSNVEMRSWRRLSTEETF